MTLTLSHTVSKPAPSRLRTCLLLLLLAILFVACADNNMNIGFLFNDDDKELHQSITFTLQDTNGTAQYVKWNNDITWTRNSQNLQDFPTIDCSKAPTFATGFTPDPNGLPQLTPYIQAIGKAQDNNTALVGRMPLHVACKWRSLTFFLGRPWRVNPWPILKDNTKVKQLSLIGQQITRLSDGRLLISGGTSQLTLGGPNHIQVEKNSIKGHLYLYNPATNELILLSDKQSDFSLTPARAFHTATWSDNRVIFSGGIGNNADGNDANVNNTVQELFITTPDMTNLSDEEKKRCAEGVGKILDIPRGDNFERLCLAKAKETSSGAFFRRIHVQGKDAQSKGISFGIPGLTVKSITTLALSNNSQPQTLFHQATYLANEQTILVTGGFTFDPSPGQERFRATNFLYSISVQPGDADNAPTLASISPITTPLQSPRAGHTATPIQNGKALLLIGGITGSLSNTTEGTNLLNINASAEVLVKNGDKGWLSKPITITNELPEESGKTDFVVRRAFHTAVRISSTSNADRILLYGGVRNLSPADDAKPHPHHYVLVEITQKDDNYTMKVLQIGHTIHEQFGLVASLFLETGQVALFGGGKTTQEKGILSFKTYAGKKEIEKEEAKSIIQLYVPGNETHDQLSGPVSPTTLGDGKEDVYDPAPNNPPPPVTPPPPPPTPPTDATLVCTHTTKPDTSFCAESKLIQHKDNVQSISVLAAPNDASNTVYHIGTFSGTPTFCRDQNGTAIQRRSTGSDDIFIIRYKEQNGKPYCDRVLTYGWKGQDSVAEATISADGKRIYLIGTVRNIDGSWQDGTNPNNPHKIFFENLNPKTQEDCTKSGAACSMAIVTTLDFSITDDGTIRHRPLDINFDDPTFPHDRLHGTGRNIAIHSSGAIFAHFRTKDYEIILHFDEKSPLQPLTLLGKTKATRPVDSRGKSGMSGTIHDLALFSDSTETRICLAMSIRIHPEQNDTAPKTPRAAILCYQQVWEETGNTRVRKWATALQILDFPFSITTNTNSAFTRIQLARPESLPAKSIALFALGHFDINPTLRAVTGGTEKTPMFTKEPILTMTPNGPKDTRHYFLLSAELKLGQGGTYKKNDSETPVVLDGLNIHNAKTEPGHPNSADSNIKIGQLQTNHDHTKVFLSGVLKGTWTFGSQKRGSTTTQTQFFTHFDASNGKQTGWNDNSISTNLDTIPAPSITSNKRHNAIFSMLLPDALDTADFACKVEGKTADTNHISAIFFSKTCTFDCNQFVCQ